MQLILLERIENLGKMGDLVTVRPGYARNYLLPQKRALRATKENIKNFKAQKIQLEAESIERRSEAQDVANKLDGQKVVVLRSAGDAGQLYGSVNNRDISAAAVEHGFKIDRRQITLTRPVKTLGLHPIRVRLHAEVFATIIINVARTDEEAKRQSALGRAIIENEPEEIEEQVIDNSELFEEGAIPTSSMSDEDKAEIEVEIENKE